MPGTIHPSPNEVVSVPADETRPRRISIPAGAKATVFFGGSITDADKEVKLADDNLSVDIAQTVLLITDANTVVIEGLAPVVDPDDVLEENFETDVKVVKPKESKDDSKVAEANEQDAVPSLSGSSAPPPSDDGKASQSKAEASKSRSGASKSASKK